MFFAYGNIVYSNKDHYIDIKYFDINTPPFFYHHDITEILLNVASTP
jgi:hypothetical protein